MDVQWYPGHMTKARRMMEENIRLVDLVIELVDARIPLSSRNPDIDALCNGKGRVVLLCKADLADPVRTEAFLAFFREKGILAVAADARERRAADLVRRYVQEACRDKVAHDRARGIVGRPLRAMVAGIPNVGKSTFINSFAGRASTKTGNRPGVTRGKQWIRLGGGAELLDTPGILWPKFDSRETGMRLALVGAVRDEILDKQELAVWLLDFLVREYPGAVEAKYLSGEEAPGEDAAASDAELSDPGALETGAVDPMEAAADPGELPYGTLGLSEGAALLAKIARARRLLKKGGEPDTLRAASMLLDDCKNGRIGRISLDLVQDAERMDRELMASLASGSAKGPQGPQPGRRRAGQRKGASGPVKKPAGAGASGGRPSAAGKKRQGVPGGGTSGSAKRKASGAAGRRGGGAGTGRKGPGPAPGRRK